MSRRVVVSLILGAFGISLAASQELTGNCPDFGFAYTADEADLLQQQQTPSWSACALLCNRSAAAAAAAAAAGCAHFQYDSLTGLCRLFAAGAPGGPPTAGRGAPHLVSGRYPVLLAGSSCVTSAALSEWGPWGPWSPQEGPLGGPPGGPLGGPLGAPLGGPQDLGGPPEAPPLLQRTRQVLWGPRFGPETLPALRQLKPAAAAAAAAVVAAADADCSWSGIGVLGWGCDPNASFEESGK
ncbi:hypothetical protein ETH_00037795 [Eimeria tenella]|uniref:PAN domain-containing protein n=1 Tax=Eimeria tenella TaxID=5802 RepID=U6L285_EIMTE|nr:hypothetical protein ETH_00037795 [Eimeria tenella]CDJ44487.1 hypothetical protein ETH_00037795 [Eimeria tenella]|eukprot:XP_013235236.1 hypothetical protein ETH_00037795 [Eimeria tenella]